MDKLESFSPKDASDAFFAGEREMQFKNAILTIASEAAVLVPENPRKAIEILPR